MSKKKETAAELRKTLEAVRTWHAEEEKRHADLLHDAGYQCGGVSITGALTFLIGDFRSAKTMLGENAIRQEQSSRFNALMREENRKLAEIPKGVLFHAEHARQNVERMVGEKRLTPEMAAFVMSFLKRIESAARGEKS